MSFIIITFFAPVLDLHRWEYMHSPSENSKEAEILEVLRHPRDWVHWHRQSCILGSGGCAAWALFHCQRCCHCVAVGYLAPELQASALGALPPGQGVKCVLSTTGFHWMLLVTRGEMAACQSQLVDKNLIYTSRIVLYDQLTKYDWVSKYWVKRI